MNFDRGFIKWQPFNSVVNAKEIMNNMSKKENFSKPEFFPEKEELLEKEIKEAYYSKRIIKLIFYEDNKFKMINTTIKNINTTLGTVELSNHHIISFYQIINIT